jgi:hypothetical protein
MIITTMNKDEAMKRIVELRKKMGQADTPEEARFCKAMIDDLFREIDQQEKYEAWKRER